MYQLQKPLQPNLLNPRGGLAASRKFSGEYAGQESVSVHARLTLKGAPPLQGGEPQAHSQGAGSWSPAPKARCHRPTHNLVRWLRA